MEDLIRKIKKLLEIEVNKNKYSRKIIQLRLILNRLIIINTKIIRISFKNKI